MTSPALPHHTRHPHHTKGIAYVMFAVLVWAGWMVSSRYSVVGTLSAYDITALRFVVAGAIMLPVLLRKGWRVGPWGVWGGIFLACGMGALYNVVAITGMRYAPTSHASLIQTSMLVSTSMLSLLFLHEFTTRVRLCGVAVSCVGIALLLLSDDTSKAGHAWWGHALFLVSGVMWSCYAVALRKWRVDPLHAAAAVCVYSALLYLPVYIAFLPSHIAQADWREAAFQALYQGFINSVLALLFYNRGVAILGAATSSAFLPLVPIFATLGAIPLLHELPGLQEWSGIGVATFGVFMATGAATRFWLRYFPKPLEK